MNWKSIFGGIRFPCEHNPSVDKDVTFLSVKYNERYLYDYTYLGFVLYPIKLKIYYTVMETLYVHNNWNCVKKCL